jgi:arsenite methyltransferase
MSTNQEIKEMVKEKYGAIASQPKKQVQSSCCENTCGCSEVDYSIVAEDYTKLQGYVPDADLGLGCGLPTQFAQIKPGDVVVDLGSGAGNDCFVARSVAGDKGRVIGIDMTEAMIERARANAGKLGFTNVEFRLGDIENIPVENVSADVVVSNCVMNLVPDKNKAFRETYRILKSGGHFSISDIVLKGELSPELRHEATLYAGCVAGALQREEYLDVITKTGFKNVKVQNERRTDIPDEVLEKALTSEQLRDFRKNPVGAFSITVFAEKP